MAGARWTADRQSDHERGLWHDARSRNGEGSIAGRHFTRVGAGGSDHPPLRAQGSRRLRVNSASPAPYHAADTDPDEISRYLARRIARDEPGRGREKFHATVATSSARRS